MSHGTQQLPAIPVTEPFDRVLEIDDGSGSVSHFPLVGEKIIIGRSAEVDLCLKHPSVSRRHAEFRCDKWGRWWVHDLGSSNGTKVNGFRTTERVLELADHVELGVFSLTLTMPKPTMADSTLHGGQKIAVTQTPTTTKSITALRQSTTEVSRISAVHLTRLMQLSQQLQNNERLSERLRLLCDLMVDEMFCALAAVVVRMDKRHPDAAPQTLSLPSTRAGTPPRSLYIPNALMAALRQKAEPMLTRHTDNGEECGAIACPIRNDEDAIDLLYLIVSPDYANEEWLTVALFATEHFKQAEAAWQARKLAKISALVEVDLERARDIQMRLVPKNINVPGLDVSVGFQPCRWVAGDYVDLLQLADGSTLLVVADVCGKGMPAALVSSSLHTMVRACAAAGSDLISLITLLNNHLVEYLPSNRFVTAIFVQIEPETGAVQFINAGHPAPLVVNPDGRMRSMELGDYEPLGLRKVEYQPSNDHMQPGQLLAMFSDGLTEMRDQSGKMLTSTRLGDHIRTIYQTNAGKPMQLIADQLNQVLDSYQAGRIQQDDRTFLMACRKA